MAVSPAERLIDEGNLIRYAERTKHRQCVEALGKMSAQKRALAKLVIGAVDRYPALMFQAIMDGWSATKIRFEINKRDRSRTTK